MLYAKRAATDQLRKINGISVEILSREIADGLLTVHVRATDKTGRDDDGYSALSTFKRLVATNLPPTP